MRRQLIPSSFLSVLMPAGIVFGQGAVVDPFNADAEVYLRSLIKELGIPGLAVTVVHDGRTLIADGFGLADPESGRKSDANTCYYIASATKPFTALLAAVLDADGTLDLDEPLGKYYPGLKLKDTIDLNAITLRDLLTHTSGLDNEAIAWREAYSGVHDPKLLDGLMTYCVRNKAGHGIYEYTNVGYNIYAMVLRNATGRSWKDLLKERVLDPAGMHHTSANMSQAGQNGWTVAKPYMVLSSTQLVPLEKQDNTMQSAGGLITTAEDMARWLELQMNEGMIGGRQVIPAACIRVTSTGSVAMPNGADRPFQPTQSGQGWMVGTYRGKKVVHHFGSFPGYAAHLSYMPEKRIGVAVMVNEAVSGQPVMDIVAKAMYDHLLDSGHTFDLDTVRTFAEQLREGRIRMEAGIAKRAERPWKLSLDRAAYAGSYTSTELGTMVIREEAGTLHASIGNLHCTATAFTEVETIRVELIPGSGEAIGFAIAEGRVTGLHYNGVDFLRTDP